MSDSVIRVSTCDGVEFCAGGAYRSPVEQPAAVAGRLTPGFEPLEWRG